MINVPSKFYVSRIYRSDEEVLGFMVVADNESTKTFQKAKERADKWASYGGSKNMKPIYFENTPRTGFRMVTNVSRYSTSNVVWRIRHPDGFEFEITSDNLCDLLETNTIVEGEFQDELFFTHSKKLVNHKTKLFSDMIKKEEKKTEIKEKTKDLEPGNIINIPPVYRYTKLPDEKYVYCGKFHAITINSNKPHVLSAKSSLKIVVKHVSTGVYYCLSKIQEDFTVAAGTETVDRDVVISDFRKQLRMDVKKITSALSQGYVSNLLEVVMINDKTFTSTDLKIEFETTKLSTINNIDESKIYVTDNKRVFGFWYAQQERMDENANAYHGVKYSNLLAYPISIVDENNMPKIDVDLSEHKGINYYDSRKNVFHGVQRYYSSNKPRLLVITAPEEIDVGYYTLGK